MLHNALDSRQQREKLLALVLEHQRASPATFRDLWLPYLEGQRLALEEPFGTTTSLEEAEVLAGLLPGAKFRLSLGHLKKDDFDAKKLAEDERLQYISGLIFDGLAITEDDLDIILQSPHLHTLTELDLGNTRIGSFARTSPHRFASSICNATWGQISTSHASQKTSRTFGSWT